MILQTDRLTLVLNSVNEVREQMERLSDDMRAEVSPLLLERALAATESDPWLHGFKATIYSHACGHRAGLGCRDVDIVARNATALKSAQKRKPPPVKSRRGSGESSRERERFG